MPACTKCGTENPDVARFCLACGTAFEPPRGLCAGCGAQNPEIARFCLTCGTPLAEAPPQEVRKVVTIVFSDLKGSTNLGEALDSEALREVMTRYFDVMKAELERHGAAIEKFIGDAVMAVFGLPRLHEDDALRAVRAAAGMQRALGALNDELELRYGVRLANRTGVNTGEVVAGDPTAGQRLVTGDAVNVAARLEQAAGKDEVLLGELTYRLVRNSVEVETVEPLELKGKSERVPAYRLVRVSDEAAEVRQSEAPMVGRGDELARLNEAFEVAVASRTCHLVTVIGEAGVGKSRLTEEFRRAVAQHGDVLSGRCLPYGEGITFWPVVETVRSAAGIVTDDTHESALAKLDELASEAGADVVARVASAIGLSPTPFRVEELFWGIRRFLETLSRRRPLVLIFEDVHWAEPNLLELVEHLMDTVEDAPLLLLCPSRPELLERRPDWGDRQNALRIVLERLSADKSRQIVENLLGQAELDGEVRSRIIDASEGNPLFVEQMLSMWIDDGLLRCDNGRWLPAADLESVTVPPTIQALLAARLDTLTHDERAVLQPASVVGYVFAQEPLHELVPSDVGDRLDAHLATLTGKQLVRPEPSAGEGSHRFHHILVRDTAYESILKRGRADLHRRFVRWADRVNADRAIEYEEILGYHLEQAYRYLSELGPLDDDGREVRADAARRLGSAGDRAFARGDMPAAANLLHRAERLLPPGDPLRLELRPTLGSALLLVGELERANAVVSETIEEAIAAGDRRQEHRARIVREFVRPQLDPAVRVDEVSRVASEAIATFESLGDDVGLARAWRLQSEVGRLTLRYGESTQALEHALAHARRARDRREEELILTWLGARWCFGPTPVDEAISRCTEMLEQGQGSPWLEAAALVMLAFLTAMRGEFAEARRLNDRSKSIVRELGLKHSLAGRAQVAAIIEGLAGEPEAARRELLEGYGLLAEMGETDLRSTLAAYLAHALYELGRDDEAEAFARTSEALSAADDVVSQVKWRLARAKILARRGELEAAEELAGEAVGLISSTDCFDDHGNALIDLARVLRLAGRGDDARPMVEEALLLFQQKGNIVSFGRALAFQSELEARATEARELA